MLSLIIWVILGIFTALIAQSKGRRAWLWAILGIIGGVFAIIVIVCMPKVKHVKKCPKCANEVKQEALICQHCYHDFKAAADAAQNNQRIQG